MEKEERKGISHNVKLTSSIILSIVFISLSSFLGEIMMPFAAAFYAVLLFVENDSETKKHIASIVCATISVLVGVLSFLFFSPMGIGIWSVASVLIGFAIYCMYSFDNSKCDTSVLITLLTSIIIFVSFILLAFSITNEYTIEAAFSYYEEIYEVLKNEFIKQAREISVLAEGAGISEEYVVYALDAIVKTIPSLIMIISFVLSGISLKVYTFTTKCFTDTTNKIHNWSFNIPVVYAYFYIILSVLAVFIDSSGIIGLAIVNLSGFVAFMFAYMGFKVVCEKMKTPGSLVLTVALIVVAVWFVGTLVVDLLSMFGVVYTIYDNARRNAPDDFPDINNTNL